jgi:formiminotetrahydrofolate cyclodeaminase
VKYRGEEMAHSIWSESLGSFSDAVAATRPAPAGVAGAAVSGELGIGLLIKTLAITGGPGELADAARLQRAHLRGAADDDIGAVTAYMRSRDAAALRQAIEAPMRAARAAVAGLELCAKASGTVKSSLTADLGAAQALLGGALRAILICIDANLHGREEEHRDALAERKAIEARAHDTGVYSR